MMRCAIGFATLVLAACALPPDPVAPSEDARTGAVETGLSGWQEAVITTKSADAWVDFLTRLAGWEVRGEAPIDDGLKVLWGLPDDVIGREILLANVGADSGFIRLVELENIEQDWIRADTRPWDTGGHFDLNMRVKGLRALREEMLVEGWQGDSEPVQFTFGPFEVVEWIVQGPDGVRLALIERLKPELENWPDLKTVSRAFNSTQTVADIGAARAYYEDVLGMQIYLEHVGASKAAGPNVLGLPHDIATQVEREIYILHPDGTNDGSIEILAFDGAAGLDLSSRASPHNIGLSVLRFPVNDLDATIEKLRDRGAVFDGLPVTVDLAVLGQTSMIALHSPEGARLELYEQRPERLSVLP
ncbi:MAG: VOC family protein [Pseudomonadota bacterium]